MVAMILPFSVMEFAEADKPNMTKRIQKPVETESHKERNIQVKALFLERLALMKDNHPLKEKYQKNGLQSLNGIEKKTLEKNLERLQEITDEVKAINVESRKEFAIAPERKAFLISQKQLIMDSVIPYDGLAIDHKAKAVVVQFTSQELIDEYVPQLDKLLTAPYYTELSNWMPLSCDNLDSTCDPLIGGIGIGTENPYVIGGIQGCSISVPMITDNDEIGFVTAAHCFTKMPTWFTNVVQDAVGNFVTQPKIEGITAEEVTNTVGEVTTIQYSGECDCAFVATNENTQTFFGYWGGYMNTNELTSKGDPETGDQVIMIGKVSGIQVGQVVNTHQEATNVNNAHAINHLMLDGDSGGIVIDMETFSVYQGLIMAGNSITGHTAIVPWTHIDAALDLQ